MSGSLVIELSEARAFLSALLSGVSDVSEIETWAEEIMLKHDTPPDWAIDIAFARSSTSEIISIFNSVLRESKSCVNLLLAWNKLCCMIQKKVDKKQMSLREAARVLRENRDLAPLSERNYSSSFFPYFRVAEQDNNNGIKELEQELREYLESKG